MLKFERLLYVVLTIIDYCNDLESIILKHEYPSYNISWREKKNTE